MAEMVNWIDKAKDAFETKGYFLYLSPSLDMERKEGIRSALDIGIVNMRLPGWVSHPFLGRLIRIEKCVEPLPEPDTTDFKVLDSVANVLGVRESYCIERPLALPSGDVVELLYSDIRPDQRGARPNGYILIVGHRHHAAHVRNLRGRIQDLLNKEPPDVVRVAKFLELE